MLVARDAFNGVILWKRTVESFDYGEKWSAQKIPRKVLYPKQRKLPVRRLVAVGNRVYFTFGMDAPVSILDAVTGKNAKGTRTHTTLRGDRLLQGPALRVHSAQPGNGIQGFHPGDQSIYRRGPLGKRKVQRDSRDTTPSTITRR